MVVSSPVQTHLLTELSQSQKREFQCGMGFFPKKDCAPSSNWKISQINKAGKYQEMGFTEICSIPSILFF